MRYWVGTGRLSALLCDAMDNLNAVRHRSFLSLLGIAIGTASVIALLNIGESTSDEAMRQFTMMGTDLIVVQDNVFGGFLRKAKPLALHDAADLQREVRGVAASIPLTNYSVKTSRLAGGDERVSIGATEGFLSAARLQLDQGRFLRDSDGYDTVVVLGSETAKALSQHGMELALGDKVRMDAYLYTVIGILKSAPKNPLLPFDIDNAFVVPVKSNRRMLMAAGGVSNLLLRVGEGYDPLVVLSNVSKFLQEQGKAAQAQGALHVGGCGWHFFVGGWPWCDECDVGGLGGEKKRDWFATGYWGRSHQYHDDGCL
jgi:putative ABC transport system permease protein